MQTADSSYIQYYNQVAQLLLQGSQGDASSLPEHYVDCLQHEFSDGDISMVSAILQADGFSDLEPEQRDEALEILHKVDPSCNPDPKSIHHLDLSELLDPLDVEREELDYVEDNLGTAEKTEKVLRTVIESVFKGSVHSIRDSKGKYPGLDNNFLQEEDGTFSGVFSHENIKFVFEIAPTEKGWICTYRMQESSLDNLPARVTEASRKGPSKDYHKPVRSRGWR